MSTTWALLAPIKWPPCGHNTCAFGAPLEVREQFVSQLDLLIVNPGSRVEVYQALGTDLTGIEPPLWAGMLATFVRNRGYAVQIVDAEAEHLSPRQVAERAAAVAPALVAVVVFGHQPSASTQNMTAAGLICRALKDLAPGVPSVLI